MSTFRYDEEEAAEALEIPGLYNDDYDDEGMPFLTFLVAPS